MPSILPFRELVDAADQLSLPEQEVLLDILSRRVIDHRRKILAKEIEEANKEFERGECRPATPEEIMKEIGLPNAHRHGRMPPSKLADDDQPR